jgi:hypothetical protein
LIRYFGIALIPCSGYSQLSAQDRTVLPVREPERSTFSELDVREVSPPQRFVVKAPEGAPCQFCTMIFRMTGVFPYRISTM